MRLRSEAREEVGSESRTTPHPDRANAKHQSTALNSNHSSYLLTIFSINMSNPGSTGLFARAQREKRLCAVAMNDVQFLAFHQSTISAIGTEGLSGCSVVMVTSQHGAILAHIPPRPSMADPQDQHAGDQNVQGVLLAQLLSGVWADALRRLP